jgi:hypothetical protein
MRFLVTGNYPRNTRFHFRDNVVRLNRNETERAVSLNRFLQSKKGGKYSSRVKWSNSGRVSYYFVGLVVRITTLSVNRIYGVEWQDDWLILSKEFGSRRSCPNWGIFQSFPGEPEGNHEKYDQDSRFPLTTTRLVGLGDPNLYFLYKKVQVKLSLF